MADRKKKKDDTDGEVEWRSLKINSKLTFDEVIIYFAGELASVSASSRQEGEGGQGEGERRQRQGGGEGEEEEEDQAGDAQ